MTNPLSIVCVCKSGGCYDYDYILHLYEGLLDKVGDKYNFICITDLLPKRVPDELHLLYVPDLEKGWWSKLSAFTIPGPAIYLDLDTVITGSLYLLATHLISNRKRQFYMLESLRYREKGKLDFGRYASGVMAWTGNWQSTFTGNHSDHSMDQLFIQDQLEEPPSVIQDFLNVRSYKHHCRYGVPFGTDVVCFHGSPRPHEIGWKI